MNNQGVVGSPTFSARKPVWRRALWTAVWAIPLAIAMDFAIGWIGDHVSRSMYRFDTTLPVVLSDEARKIDLLIVGGCRAALNIDPQILGKRLGGLQVFNAGKVVEGLGMVEFTTYIGLTHHNPKTVVIVVDDGNLQETIAQDAVEAADKLPWLSLMLPDYQRAYETVYSPPLLSRVSGLWRYRGQGREIGVAAVKALLHRPVATVDGYTPRAAEQNILVAIKSDEAAMRRNIERTQTLSGHARGVISRLVAAVKADGGRPVLVVVPMHHFRATDYVNDRQFAIISELARQNDVSAIFYPDNNSRFAHTDSYWSDQGHMNRLGAEHFAEILGNDLSLLLARPGGGNVVVRPGSGI